MIGITQARRLVVGNIAALGMIVANVNLAAATPPAPKSGVINLGASVTSTYQGFMKYVYSFSLPAGTIGMTGLTGSVLIATATVPQFPNSPSEALFSVGYLPSGSCLANGSKFTDYISLFAAIPGAVLTASFIVKNLASGGSSASTIVDFPYAITLAPSGGKTACAFVILDGGPSLGYLSPIASIQMVSSMQLNYISNYSQPAPPLVGGGDEVCFGMTTGCQIATTIQGATFASVTPITQGGQVVSLYGDVSDYRLNNVMSTMSAGNAWLIDTGCSHFPGITGWKLYGPDNYYSTFANTPKLYDRVQSFTGKGLQFTVNQTRGLPKVMNGDCYVHLIGVTGTGEIDAESQVKLEIQP